MEEETDTKTVDSRREFLKNCGKFAVITPPTVTFLLSTSLSSKAIAASGGGSRPGWGYGDQNHGHSGPPGLTDAHGGSRGEQGGKPSRAGEHRDRRR